MVNFIKERLFATSVFLRIIKINFSILSSIMNYSLDTSALKVIMRTRQDRKQLLPALRIK